MNGDLYTGNSPPQGGGRKGNHLAYPAYSPYPNYPNYPTYPAYPTYPTQPGYYPTQGGGGGVNGGMGPSYVYYPQIDWREVEDVGPRKQVGVSEPERPGPVERMMKAIDRFAARTFRQAMIKNKRILEFLKFVPAIVCTGTVLLNFGIGLALGHSFTTIPVPYLSYTGVDIPEKIFFITGLAFSSFVFQPVLFANQAGLLYLKTSKSAIYTLSYIGYFAAFLSSICLILLSIFDVQRYTTIHYVFAISFFSLSGIWMVTDATANFLWYREDKRNSDLKRAVIIKYVSCIILFTSLLLFLLITLSNASCAYLMEIKNYHNCPSNHISSAIIQYILLGNILSFIALITFDKYENSVLADKILDDSSRKRFKRYSKRVGASHDELEEEEEEDEEENPEKKSGNLKKSGSNASGISKGKSKRNSKFDSDSEGDAGSPDPPRRSLDAKFSHESGRLSGDNGVDDLPVPPFPQRRGTYTEQRSTASIDSMRYALPTQPILDEPVEEPGSFRKSRYNTSRSTKSTRSNNTSDGEGGFEDDIPMRPPLPKKASRGKLHPDFNPGMNDNLITMGTLSRSSVDVHGISSASAPSTPSTPFSVHSLGTPSAPLPSAPSAPSAPPPSAPSASFTLRPDPTSERMTNRRSSLESIRATQMRNQNQGFPSIDSRPF